MEPTVNAPTDTCREFLGERGWCPAEPTIWWQNSRYCGRHAIERQRYDAETLRRSRGAA